MSAVHKINDDFYDDSFLLIALHSTLEDYSLVYGFNSYIKTAFKRAKQDFNLSENRCFPFYEWQDEYQDRYWVLISNYSTKQEQHSNNDLFQNESTFIKPRLVPELKDVDYFLKIEEEENLSGDEVVRQILAIPRVMAAYEVEKDKLKSKNNLIF